MLVDTNTALTIILVVLGIGAGIAWILSKDDKK
jgi:hypothetical protein